MRRTRGFLPLAGVFAFVVLGMGSALGDLSTPYVPDQVLVKFRPGTPASEVARTHASIHAAIRDEIPQIGVQIVGLPRGLSVGRAIGFYRRNPNVEFVEPDYYVEGALVPNDPDFRYGQIPLQWMNAEAAWDITTGSSSVAIAILDSGAEFTHPDLQGRLVAGWDFVAGDADPGDEHGHGTMVTGVAGATTNNDKGVAGVTWISPVLIVRIGDSTGWTTWSRMAQGVTYATDHGSRAINLSFAGTSYPSSVASAVDYAWSKGAVTVASAGNDASGDPHYPAAIPRVVAVSGVEDHDLLVYYSNYGSWVDVCAPCGSRTTWPGGVISNTGGTSISAPFVTGLFGLVFSANPSLTPQQAVDIVCQTATDLGDPGFDQYYGWGKINLYRAVLAASQAAGGGDSTQPTTAIVAPVPACVLSGTTEITASASDDTGVETVELYLDGQLAGWVNSTPYQWTWDTIQEADGEHVIQAKARDRAGNMGESALVTVTVRNTPAQPEPITETFTGSVGFARKGTSQIHRVNVSAPGTVSAALAWGGKGDLNLYAYSPSGLRVAVSATKSAPETISFTAAEIGTYALEVVAASGKASYTLTVTHP